MSAFTELKKKNYKIYVRHRRYYPEILTPLSEKEAREEGYFLSDCETRGGLTELEVYDDIEPIAKASARCSVEDNYNKKVGREIAARRIFEALRNS